MADSTTTSNSGTSGAKKSSAKDDGYETISVRVPKDRDEALTQRLISQLEGPKQTVVGNFADLQRMGTSVVNGGKADEGVFAPPVVTDPDTGDTQDFNPQSLEDVAAPGPVSLGADAAEAALGDRVAQGERPDNKK